MNDDILRQRWLKLFKGLASFLKEDRLYLTDYFFEKYECEGRKNLIRAMSAFIKV